MAGMYQTTGAPYYTTDPRGQMDPACKGDKGGGGKRRGIAPHVEFGVHQKTQTNAGFLVHVVSEFKASFIYYFLAIGSAIGYAAFARRAMADPGTSVGTMEVLLYLGTFVVAYVHGYAVTVAVTFLGHYSADINPALTLARLLLYLFPFTRVKDEQGISLPVAAFRLVAQVLACVVAVLCLYAVGFSFEQIGDARPHVGEGYSTLDAFWAETFGTAAIVMCALLVYGQFGASEALGKVIALNMVVLSMISGASFGWWRYLSCLAAGVDTDEDWWIWIIGPVVGAVLSVSCYVLVFHGGVFENHKQLQHAKQSSQCESIPMVRQYVGVAKC